MNIVYMGTSAFAVPTLARLFEAGLPIGGVVTRNPTSRPDAGKRSRKLRLSGKRSNCTCRSINQLR